MATLRRALYASAAVWFLSGLGIAAAPHFWLVTVFDQVGYPDFAYVRFAGTEGIALSLLMVMVANHLEDNWWWSWAFVIATGAMAIVAIVNVAAGLPHGSSSGLWWLIFATNGLLVLGLLYGLAKTGTERSPV
jgi:hypothetical protein